MQCASHVVSDEAFAVILADDLLDNKDGTPVLKQMVDVYNYHRCSVLGTMNVPREETRSYGIVSTESDKGQVQRMTGIVEKPKPEEAPTTQAVVGRYILTPRIFDHIRALKPGAGGEYQLTDAIASLLKEEAVLAYQFNGVRYDCGSKLGYLKATIEFGLRHPETGADFAPLPEPAASAPRGGRQEEVRVVRRGKASALQGAPRSRRTGGGARRAIGRSRDAAAPARIQHVAGAVRAAVFRSCSRRLVFEAPREQVFRGDGHRPPPRLRRAAYLRVSTCCSGSSTTTVTARGLRPRRMGCSTAPLPNCPRLAGSVSILISLLSPDGTEIGALGV